jgi:hypothetical protein
MTLFLTMAPTGTVGMKTTNKQTNNQTNIRVEIVVWYFKNEKQRVIHRHQGRHDRRHSAAVHWSDDCRADS